MKEKHLFAGVNSPKGFYSRFDCIMQEEPGTRKIFIKGGPGMGKSTLMKKIAQRAAESDLECEVFHCSSDPASVDGVHIPKLKTAIIDATAPHNADPIYPCVSGEIFDVSPFIQRDKLISRLDEIAYCTKQKKQCFQKGYRYLAAALPLLDQIECEYQESTDARSIYAAAEDLALRVFGNLEGCKQGKKRQLFVSAITPEGFVNYADSMFSDTYCIAVKGSFGASLFVKRFAELADIQGFSPVLFYCPMRPDERIEHVYIPQLRFALTSYNFYTHASAAETVELDEFIRISPGSGENYSYAGTMMQRAIDAFAEAKAAHAALEGIYVPAMQFESLQHAGERLIESIF